MRLALIGYGRVGRALAALLERQRAAQRFRITGILTRRGCAINTGGLPSEPTFGPARTVDDFLAHCPCEAVVEVTSLNPIDGEPAIGHIRAAFAHGLHVVTANKGPVAHAWRELHTEASARGLRFLHEAAVLDGAPVFSLVRHSLSHTPILGFAGALNVTSQVILAAMQRGLLFEDGVREAQRLGLAEADPWFDIEGWDSACKAAALANVLMDARVTPQQVDRKGISRLTPEKLAEIEGRGKRAALVSRAHRGKDGVKLRVRAEVLDRDDPLVAGSGQRSVLLLETALAGTIGIISVGSGVEQTAAGLYADLLEIARGL